MPLVGLVTVLQLNSSPFTTEAGAISTRLDLREALPRTHQEHALHGGLDVGALPQPDEEGRQRRMVSHNVLIQPVQSLQQRHVLLRHVAKYIVGYRVQSDRGSGHPSSAWQPKLNSHRRCSASSSAMSSCGGN